MNPGYLTIFVVCTTVILLASGWKDVLLGEISRKAIFIFLSGWLFFSMFTVPFSLHMMRIQLNLTFLFLFVYCLVYLASLHHVVARMQMLLVALIICLIDFILQQAATLPLGTNVLLLSLVTICLQKGPKKQIFSLLLGLLCGNVLSIVTLHRTQPILLANQRLQDMWWLALLMTRALSILFKYILSSCKKAYMEWIKQ
ncbi:MAG: hypothetical protein JWM44_1846 [Bacilli bacterium]|jgi:hypothetical protein|nr:hypothetical protein [Bacilli bacterium]